MLINLFNDIPTCGSGINNITDYRNFYHRIEPYLDEIRTTLQANQWRDISTSPDGKNVLIAIPLEGGGFLSPVIAYRNGKYWYSEFRGKMFSVLGLPSHWKPLDLPPGEK